VEFGSNARPTGYIEAVARSMAERNHHPTFLLFSAMLASQFGVE
jgi:hypothetical protein